MGSGIMNRMVNPGLWDIGIVLIWLVIIALVGTLIYLLASRYRTSGTLSQTSKQGHHDAALNTLEQRYATGEISEDQFRKQRETIVGDD